MSDETRTRAEASLKEVEAITANLLPEPSGALVAADTADPATTSSDWRPAPTHRPGTSPLAV